MSTRWYPIYQKGNPQLRIFLPNFWMKLIKNNHTHKSNVVQFHCSMEMTRLDVKNYLEKIYKVPVIKVDTRIALGRFKKNALGTIVKEDDIKVAYVSLPRYEKFEFPKLFDHEMKKKEKENEDNALDEAKENFKKVIEDAEKKNPGLPPWFQY